jgi:uncharacterized membrane protein
VGGEYALTDFQRGTPMLVLVLIFVAVTLLFARLRGALSLVGLAASLALVLLFVVPAILDGKPPLAVAVVGSLAVALVTIPLAHGGGPKSVAALLGTASSLLLTALLASVFTEAAPSPASPATRPATCSSPGRISRSTGCYLPAW